MDDEVDIGGFIGIYIYIYIYTHRYMDDSSNSYSQNDHSGSNSCKDSPTDLWNLKKIPQGLLDQSPFAFSLDLQPLLDVWEKCTGS